MFRHVFAFEFRYHLRSAVFWLGATLFFLMIFGAITTDVVQIGGAIGNVNRNSPSVIIFMMAFASIASVFVTTAFVAGAVLRDRELGTHEILFSTGISKTAYVLGRFAGAYAASVVMTLSIVPAIVIGSLMPWLEPERIGPFLWQPYVWGFVFMVLPNLLIMGALFFGLATLTKSLMYTYVGLVAMFVGYGVAGTLIRDVEKEGLATLIDPYGGRALGIVTKYWTTVERNTLVPGLAAPIIHNRLLWVAIALGLLALTWWRFSFSVEATTRRHTARAAGAAAPVPGSALAAREQGEGRGDRAGRREATPAAARDFGAAARRRQFTRLTRMEFVRNVRSLPFAIILALGILNVIGSAAALDEFGGTAVYPVTHIMLSATESAFLLFAFIILVLYSGETVWRDRTTGVSDVLDALPVPDRLIWQSKLAATMLLMPLLLSVSILCGIGFQAFHGYTHFELPLYFEGTFLFIGVPFLQVAVLAFLVQTLARNKYIGFLFLVLYILSQPILFALHFEHNLYLFGGSPSVTYSDMNGYGHFVTPTFWFQLYWSLVAVLFGVVIHLFWLRGRETEWRHRRRLARARFTPRVRALTIATAMAVAATGGWIWYNTNVLNEYIPSNVATDRRADFEKNYKRYEGIAQPKITAVQADVDIYPERRAVDIRGRYTIRNKTTTPVDSIHIVIPPQLDVTEMDVPDGSIAMDDSLLGYRIYRLASPMQPGDEKVITFTVGRAEHGFPNSGSNTQLVYNGTFFNNFQYFPHIGYPTGFEIQDPNERRKRHLPPVERMPKLENEAARMNNYITPESDWIDYETTVSTSPDQIAIAPGYLQKEWQENGRRYFHYRMDSPILGFFAYLSARYEVARDKWNGVDIEIYYDRKHPYNVARMIDAVKKALDYYTTNFGPYQHHQVRILEFPRYASFAQSFPNTIPYSEGIGFIAKVEKPDDIDYVFYVTAHEVAHQWWAHQVIGGNVQGATMTSETMSQYSALMVMEKEYGPAVMRRFLKYELDRYLRGRGGERIEELPLLRVENQQYIHYNKGSLVFYALRDWFGEAPLDSALAAYISRVKFQEPPYTTSRELLDAIGGIVPADRQATLDDLFERIVLYDNRATSATWSRQPDGRYAVHLTVESKRFIASGNGREQEAPVDEWMDIGVFGAKEAGGPDPGRPLLVEKRHITQSSMVFDLLVDGEPARAGIDPFNKLIDRNPDNNVTDVSSEKQ
jgi:ABC-2 type transport system permease protein